MNKNQITDLVRLILHNARIVWSCCCVGNPCQMHKERYEIINNPKPGDLVVETSSLKMWDENPLNSLGRLIAVKEMPIDHIEWDDEEKPLETYWFIETIDGQLMRWHNCNFIVVFETSFEYWRPEKKSVSFFTDDEKRKFWVRGAIIRHGLEFLSLSASSGRRS